MKMIILFLFVFISFHIWAQQNTTREGCNFQYDEMPQYPGGELEMRKFIEQNVRYPKEAKDKGIFGKVYVRFVLKSDGEINQVLIARSVDPLLDAEALRVVKLFPRWIPVKQDENPNTIWYTIPFNFVIDKNEKASDSCLSKSDSLPRYEGGELKLYQFIAENIKHPHTYDEFVVDEKIYIHFLVKTDGYLDSIGVLYPPNKLSKYPLYEKEAIRVVLLTDGKWRAGTKNGIPSTMWYTVVVRFKLDERD